MRAKVNQHYLSCWRQHLDFIYICIAECGELLALLSLDFWCLQCAIGCLVLYGCCGRTILK